MFVVELNSATDHPQVRAIAVGEAESLSALITPTRQNHSVSIS